MGVDAFGYFYFKHVYYELCLRRDPIQTRYENYHILSDRSHPLYVFSFYFWTWPGWGYFTIYIFTRIRNQIPITKFQCLASLGHVL